jgi:hypothetical protein
LQQSRLPNSYSYRNRSNSRRVVNRAAAIDMTKQQTATTSLADGAPRAGQRRIAPSDRTVPLVARIALATAVLATLGLPLMARHAKAADTTDQDDRSDRISEQEDAVDAAQDAALDRRAAGQPTPASPNVFNFRVNAPLYYNSNATEAQSGGPSALEGDPELELGWSRNLTSLPLRLSVKLRADTDRYANASEGDEDEVSGTFKASYYNAQDDQQWSPFFSYKSAAIFDPTFSPWTETKNDLALGVDKVVNFDGDFHLLPPSAKSRIAAVWSFGVSTYVQRRLRVPGPSSTAFYVVPSVTYVPAGDWTISLFGSTRERWFDSVTSGSKTTSRRDFEIEPIFTVAYDTNLPGAPQIALQTTFERRSSNLSNKSWNQWAVGPVLTANWKF